MAYVYRYDIDSGNSIVKDLTVVGFKNNETEIVKSYDLAVTGENEYSFEAPIFSSSLFFENATIYAADVATKEEVEEAGSIVNVVKYDIAASNFVAANTYQLDTADSRIAAYSSTFIVTDKQAIINYTCKQSSP